MSLSVLEEGDEKFFSVGSQTTRDALLEVLAAANTLVTTPTRESRRRGGTATRSGKILAKAEETWE